MSNLANLNPHKGAAVRWVKLPTFSYPPEMADRARRLRQIHSMQSTADILGVSKQWVQTIEARGWKIKKAGRPLPERPGDFAIQCNHMTKKALCQHYGVSQGTIIKWLEGVSRDYAPIKPRRGHEIPAREVIEEALSGRSIDEAENLLGVSARTLRRWRLHHGFPIEPRKRAEKPGSKSLGWAENYFPRAA